MNSLYSIFRTQREHEPYENLDSDNELGSYKPDEEPSIPSSSIYTSREEDALFVFESSAEESSNEFQQKQHTIAQFDSFELPLSVTRKTQDDSEIPTNEPTESCTAKSSTPKRNPYRQVCLIGICIVVVIVLGAIVIPILVLMEDDASPTFMTFSPTMSPLSTTRAPTNIPSSACLDTTEEFPWNGALRTCDYAREVQVALKVALCREGSIGAEQCPVSCGRCP